MQRSPQPDWNLSSWLEYMGAIHVSAIDMGLERAQKVLDALDVNAPSTVISVAGTNGKGSTSHSIATLLQAQGVRVGLYQSPHLLDFNERIKIDGKSVADDALIDAFWVVERARVATGQSLSFFEMTTLAAFVCFHKQNLDAWVLEIGLGGRLDVVNLIAPTLAVITSIGIDHTDWLGADIQSIGREKAGILRPNIACVLGENMPQSVHDEVKKLGVNVALMGHDFTYHADGDDWLLSTTGATMRLPMSSLAMSNVAMAIMAVLMAGFSPSIDIIATVCQNLSLAGRFDRRIHGNRQWLYDVAHNSAGVQFLLRHFMPIWRAHLHTYPQARLFVVFSMLGDKDIIDTLQVAQSTLSATWHSAPIAHERAMSADDLAQALVACGIVHTMHPSLADACGVVNQTMNSHDWVLAFGSFHVVSECLLANDGDLRAYMQQRLQK